MSQIRKYSSNKFVPIIILHSVLNVQNFWFPCREKAACWQKIAEEFNATNGEEARTSQQLKTKYESIKKEIKIKVSDNKKGSMGTGGGPYSQWPESSMETRMLDIMGPAATGHNVQNFDDQDSNEGIYLILHHIVYKSIIYYIILYY